jgi:acyl-CoA thioesterase
MKTVQDYGMTLLDTSLALTALPGGGFSGVADPGFEANSGMFGGWTAALLVRAVLQTPAAAGSVSAITVNYINRVVPGSTLRLAVQGLGGGKSLSHWRCDLYTVDGDMAATATVVLAHRKPGAGRTEFAMPAAPAPQTIATFHPPGPFGGQVDVRAISGAAMFNQPAHSLGWEATMEVRPLDAIGLILLADLGWPRAWALGDSPRLSSTITLSTYIHATDEDLAVLGHGFILSDMTATRAASATIGSRKDMWSEAGALLATSEQLCWFR